MSVVACGGEPRGPKPKPPSAEEGGAGGEPSVGGSTSNAGTGGKMTTPPPDPPVGGEGGTVDPGTPPGGEAGEGITAVPCRPIVAEPLPARVAITSLDGAPDPVDLTEVITLDKADLFEAFVDASCGLSACHGGADDPLAKSPNIFKVTADSFDQRPDLGTLAIERILSLDPDTVMPPGANGANNPARVLGERLKAWEDAGFPEEIEFTIQKTPPKKPDTDIPPYLLSPTLGERLTNLGSCLPMSGPLFDMRDMRTEMQDKDRLFASITESEGLPLTLEETDLGRLDSAELAARGVFSYAPTYSLFSDNAKKMRHVRVPVGKTIRYNPETRDFDIPDDTRFYKTFLKKVVDKDGNVGYRKMETRLIVVRRDEELPGGKYRTRALRAAYAWDKEESTAERVTDPLRNGLPATDRLCSYVFDETEPRDPTKNPISDEVSEHCTYMTQAEMDDPSSGRVRHYAIPSTQRCDQCHMGSTNHSYILGFTPWQVDRRPDGEGGVYEAPTEDELTQLRRLIDYGVITGIEPGEAKLEESQGDRAPRNAYELKAQGYMLGNCAFCHNPKGFPVVENPILSEFDMFPSETGGVFQFSLEKFSPRAKAGPAQLKSLPYITSGFGDVDVEGSSANDQVKKEGSYPGSEPVLDASDNPPDWLGDMLTYVGPWRSLIWRNVYTPFTYEEDGTIFVHMPRNVAGYDCRAQKIMAEWMLSIPSIPKVENQDDYAKLEQPMEEVDPIKRPITVKQGERRIEVFRRSLTGAHCPEDDDIIDPKVVLSPRGAPPERRKERIVPRDDGVLIGPRVNPNFAYPFKDQVPDHAHWVTTDTTDKPGAWEPRRGTWDDLLVTRTADAGSDKLARVIDDLQKFHLSSEQVEYALEPLPMGRWHPDCESAPEVADSPDVEALKTGDLSQPLHRWLGGPLQGKVHFQSRGETVFRGICQNCHGRDADSRSPLAATILELTGGTTRVANFVDGLFGPKSAPGSYARGEFLVDNGATPEEWQVRYMLFMGLGGTTAEIPGAVLNLVAASPFYGTVANALGGGDPNMLDSAVQLCLRILEQDWQIRGITSLRAELKNAGTFVPDTGHFELWESLCTHGNEPVVRAFIKDPSGPSLLNNYVYRAKNANGDWIYPPDQPVGNVDGEVETGIKPSNVFPWCLRVDSEAQRADALALTRKFGIPDDRAPLCPSALFAKSFDTEVHQIALSFSGTAVTLTENNPLANARFAEQWGRHGAMNAGMAAYYYLRGLTSRQLKPSLPFDFCRQ